jgi:hypothetical protein
LNRHNRADHWQIMNLMLACAKAACQIIGRLASNRRSMPVDRGDGLTYFGSRGRARPGHACQSCSRSSSRNAACA